MIVVVRKLMSVVLYSSFSLNCVMMFFCFLCSFFIVFVMILIEEKFVNEIRNIDIIVWVCVLKWKLLDESVCIVINLFDIIFVVIMFLVFIVLFYGILVKNVNGVNI